MTTDHGRRRVRTAGATEERAAIELPHHRVIACHGERNGRVIPAHTAASSPTTACFATSNSAGSGIRAASAASCITASWLVSDMLAS